jgi:HK97 family phage major capsid protein
MNIKEQLDRLRATRAATVARQESIQEKATSEERTKDEAERKAFDDATQDIDTIDAEIKDLEGLEKRQIEKALIVDTTNTAQAGSGSREFATVKTVEKLEPGIAFARMAMCLGKAKGDHAKAFRIAEKHYPNTEGVVTILKAQSEGFDLGQALQQKATVAAGSTTDATWASPLVYASNYAGDFVDFLRPRTLIGQAQFRKVPFNVRIGGQTSGGSAKWVGQGKAKPVTKFDYIAYTTAYTKVAAIAVLTQELIRLSDPSAEASVRDSLADAVIERVDYDLFDPDVAAVSGVNPAGLLVGVSPIAGPTASTAAAVEAAINALWAPWDSTNMGARPAYYSTPGVARWLSSLRLADGQALYPQLSRTGGNINGVPVRVSQYLANNGGSGGAPFILVDESEIWLADDGSVTLDASEQATIEMSDTPVGSTVATVTSSGSPFVSMWQANSVAFRAERAIWWAPRRTGAIQWIDGMPTQ